MIASLVLDVIIIALLLRFLYLEGEFGFLSISKRPTNVNDVELTDELSDVEIAIMERNREFDERINKLKEELALKNVGDGYARRGSVAEEMHPGVKNLPHDSVNTYGAKPLPDVEYAD